MVLTIMSHSDHFGPEDDFDNYRILDAAETLVTLQSVQQEQQLQQQQQQQQIINSEGGGVIFLSTTPPSTSAIQMSPLNSPILHHLSAAYVDDLPKTPQPQPQHNLSHVSFLSPRSNNASLVENQGETDMDLSSLTSISRSHSTSNGDDAFDLSLSSPRLMGPPPTPPRFEGTSPSAEMMRPPPNPPPSRRARGRGRGSSSAERGSGGRGRGRGRGRGAKVNNSTPPIVEMAEPTGENGDTSEGAYSLQASSVEVPKDDTFQVGDMTVKNSLLDELLNARKIELFHDPDIQALIRAASQKRGKN